MKTRRGMILGRRQYSFRLTRFQWLSGDEPVGLLVANCHLPQYNAIERGENAMSVLTTTQIEVPHETAQLLMAKAAVRQLSLDEYLRIMAESDSSPRLKTLDEILAPFRAEVEAKGYSENDLDELFTEARKEVSQAKQG
ncbi:MAG: hypothetical protein HYR56_17030 [Acidobacteria bacterium]|nr:hypothetical protein [Acidobacteriota bacterium]